MWLHLRQVFIKNLPKETRENCLRHKSRKTLMFSPERAQIT